MDKVTPLPSQEIQPVKKSSFFKKKFIYIGISILLLLLLILILHRRYILHKWPFTTRTTIQNQSQTSTNTTNGNPTSAIPGAFDCLGNASCPEITIQGDPAATLSNGQPAGFRGFADPSIRKDPSSNTLWLAYSWPNIVVVNGQRITPAVDIHLASSNDSGNTWQSAGVLWTSVPDTNKGGDNGPGYDSNEVANILPVLTNSSVTWYGIRSSYFLPQIGNYAKRPVNSFRLLIAQAATPQGLKTAPTAVLGSSGTANGWNIDTRLSSLSPEVQNCTIFTEPALYYQENSLYLVTHCMVGSGTQLDESNSNIVVFATNPTNNIHTWKWRYVGTLVKGSDAAKLPINGPKGFTQGEIAKSKDGSLLFIATPYINSSSSVNLNHFGCFVFQVQSIDPPHLATDTNGKLKILATITSSDLGTAGPGSCSYDPSSTTGIIIARRHLGQVPSTSSINATGIRP